MPRYTRKDAQSAFRRLVAHLGKRHTRFDHSPDDVGSWYLDYNSVYGGAVIEEVVNLHYGVKILGNRMKAHEFCEAVRLAICLFDEINKEV